MTRAENATTTTAHGCMRCAIYTRKSTEEGLDREFNSLEAQREAAESFIASQRTLGWQVLPRRYDDGGYTGANLERPGLRELLQDIEAGAIDCVVVYKVDRLSRSLLDFARVISIFDKWSINLVAVTQPFNTTTSAGRLILNVLLSFAQFEREMIAERTRDKMAAARRRGKWTGGRPPLGYEVAPEGGRLVVKQECARQVQTIFSRYLEHRSVDAVLCEMNIGEFGDRNRAGRAFTRNRLKRLLRNPIYIGKVACDGELYQGEHEATINPEVWRQANELLKQEDVGKFSVKRPVANAVSSTEPPERVARIARLLALAWKLEGMLRAGVQRATLAEVGQVSRSRLTQITSLIFLAPDLQEQILFLDARSAGGICENALRTLCSVPNWTVQRQRWRELRGAPSETLAERRLRPKKS